MKGDDSASRGPLRNPPAGEQAFLLGANYAWVHYGGDFGGNGWGARGVSDPQTRAQVDADFAGMAQAGLQVVRWFLFCDGRAGIVFERGVPTGLDARVLADMDAALETAGRHALQVNFVLFDYTWLLNETRVNGVRLYGHAEVLRSAAGRDALRERVLLPVLERYDAHPGLYSWEVMNEPEWVIAENAPMPRHRLREPIPLGEFHDFAREVAAAVHHRAAGRATLGAARLKWLGQWRNAGLDYYQFHYYPRTEEPRGGSFREFLDRGAAALALDRPVVLGEFPANEPEVPGYSATQVLDACCARGLAGAWVWKWRQQDGEQPDYGPPPVYALRAWAEARSGAARPGLTAEDAQV